MARPRKHEKNEKIYISGQAKALLKESTKEVGVFEAFASTSHLDRTDDIINPGAFTKTLKELGDRRALFYMHNTMEISALLGTATEIKETESGLFTKGEIKLNTQDRRDAFEFIQDKTIDVMSIGFNILDAMIQEIEGKFIRFIKELSLNEISIIPIGMAANLNARITNVKSFDPNAVFDYLEIYKNDEVFTRKVLAVINGPEVPGTTPIDREPGGNNSTQTETFKKIMEQI